MSGQVEVVHFKCEQCGFEADGLSLDIVLNQTVSNHMLTNSHLVKTVEVPPTYYDTDTQPAAPSPTPWRMVKRGADAGFRINILPSGDVRSIADVIDFGCKEQVNQHVQPNREQEANAALIVRDAETSQGR